MSEDIKVEEQDGTLVASTDIADGDNRTIVLKYMPDGTIAIDCENDPELVAKYQEQINQIIEQNRRPMFNVLKMPPKRYGPCIDCGNPAKGGHCFKCQQKTA